MKNKYYQLVATIDNEQEVIFGSFIRSEVVYEKDAEKHSLKEMGYKQIKVISTETDEEPDAEVYKGQLA